MYIISRLTAILEERFIEIVGDNILINKQDLLILAHSLMTRYTCTQIYG